MGTFDLMLFALVVKRLDISDLNHPIVFLGASYSAVR